MQTVNLQGTLAAASAAGDSPTIRPHHPISCSGPWLELDGENRLSCPHAETEAGDRRVESALRHSIAILIIELASAL